jgi:hypothetical protein
MRFTATDFEPRYAAMSDEEFARIRREDLIDVARECYDREQAKRASPEWKMRTVAEAEDKGQGSGRPGLRRKGIFRNRACDFVAGLVLVGLGLLICSGAGSMPRGGVTETTHWWIAGETSTEYHHENDGARTSGALVGLVMAFAGLGFLWESAKPD